jgi:hypothetical protein
VLQEKKKTEGRRDWKCPYLDKGEESADARCSECRMSIPQALQQASITLGERGGSKPGEGGWEGGEVYQNRVSKPASGCHEWLEGGDEMENCRGELCVNGGVGFFGEGSFAQRGSGRMRG